MSNLQQVQINEPTESENISLEEQAAMQEAANPQSETTEATPATEESRPEWLPEKFQSAEDLAKAYGELEKKVGQPRQEAATEESTTEEATGISGTLTSATNEFIENGELSEESFEALAKEGLPRELVESYIQGQQAMMETQSNQVKETVGGDANYQAMAEWAAENLSEGEIDAFNEIVESGTIDQANVAVRGLYAEFRSAGGKAPNLLQGSTSGTGGAKPFNSAAQVTEAMRDPKYKNDPAYRELVEQRLAVTTAF